LRPPLGYGTIESESAEVTPGLTTPRENEADEITREVLTALRRSFITPDFLDALERCAAE
jgi:hypothetical protein